jgi:hypothetical protein
MINSAPKFRKIILLIKDEENKPIDSVEYLDSAMIITGNYVIITEEQNANIDNPATISGNIYEMKQIHSYKLFKY